MKIKAAIRHRKALFEMLRFYLYFQERPNQSLWGSLSEKEEAGVQHAIELAEADTGPIIEIGALFGHTTNLIASIKAPEKELIAVE